MLTWSPPVLLCLLLHLRSSISFSLKNCTVHAGGASAEVFVDCASRELLTVPDDVPRDATTVKLSYNLLTRVKRNDVEHLTKVKFLDLQSNEIAHIDDGSFLHMRSLTKLQLSKNKLSELTAQLFQGLSNLTHLHLSSNIITFIHPSTFKDLPSLQTVVLDVNRLKEMADIRTLLILPKLRNLTISSNLFTSFQSKDLLLDQPSSLRVLDVSYSIFEAFSISAATFPHLEMIDLSQSAFTWNITDRTSLQNITRLFFSHTKVSSRQIQEILQNMASLKHLRMNYIDEWIREGLLATVCRIPSLRVLELYLNKVPNLSAQVEFCSELVQLDLSCSDVSEVPPGSFRLMKQLSLLNLEVNLLTKVPEDIRNISSLQVLYLSDNLITEVGCEEFSNTSALVELYLDSNRITSLQRCSFENLLKLRILDLNNNLLWKIEGVFSRGPAKLQLLDLSRNSVSVYDDGYFQSLGWLTHLDVSSDKVGRVTSEAFVGLHRLKSLHVSIPLDYECDFRGLKQLENLTISMTISDTRSPPKYSQALFHLKSLRSFHVSCQGFHYGFPLDVPLSMLSSMTQLEEFTADNIYLSAPDPETFRSNSRLRSLKISQTDLSDLDPEMFRPIPDLQSLDLSGTQISSLEFLLQVDFSSLRDLRLCDNDITSINHTLFQFLPSLTLLDLTNNPLTCDCLNAGFILWVMDNNQTQVINGHQYSCSFPVAKKGTNLLDFEVQFCWIDVDFLCFLSSTCLVVLTLLISFTYHFLRWQLLYAFHLFLAFIYDNRNRKQQNPPPYDAFVSYNVEDELWVYEEMLPALEDQQGWKLCLHHRDFQPGKPIMENITDAIYNSRKTICVISRSYLQSEWCSREIQMASFRLFDEQKDVLILLFLEEIPAHQLSPYHRMRKLLKRQTYLSWTQAGRHQAGVFWQNVQRALESGDAPHDQVDPLTGPAEP
ncbi:toll-like receptor 13 [Takifugu flavidus]|uniref:toll-like receptor 13 n=1 Tax=Takifugu flavidus TaxID=433684 RepID=UPI0025447F11|nr:toll-like receptor 13 [Takifugu flavidus]XP_056876981.1 toll-like receptor 13 [Takifugu flavidus]